MYKNPWLARKQTQQYLPPSTITMSDVVFTIPNIPNIPDFIVTANIPSEIKLNLPPITFSCADLPLTIDDGVQVNLPPDIGWLPPPVIEVTINAGVPAWDFQTALGDTIKEKYADYVCVVDVNNLALGQKLEELKLQVMAQNPCIMGLPCEMLN